jgi:hypothetical protein
MEQTMTVKPVSCGKGHGYHASVADVRRCYNGEEVELIDVGQTPTGANRANDKQVKYATDLLRAHGVETVKPVSAYGRREISPLINLLKNNKPGELRPRDLREFGLARVSDGGSLAPGQSASYTDPKAREGYVQVPGLNDVWVPAEQTKAAPRFDPQTLEDGFYVRDGVVYKVIRAVVQGSGRKYAKRLDERGRFQYDKAAITRLRPEHKMTLAKALEVAHRHATDINSKLYGRCFVCGRTLTREESIERMMGPVCAGKFE